MVEICRIISNNISQQVPEQYSKNERLILFSPFVPVRSVEAAVTGDVRSLSVVGIEKEKNIGIQTGVNHNRDSGESIKNRTPRLRTPSQ